MYECMQTLVIFKKSLKKRLRTVQWWVTESNERCFSCHAMSAVLRVQNVDTSSGNANECSLSIKSMVSTCALKLRYLET